MDKTILEAWNEKQNKVREWIAHINQENYDYGLFLEETLRILFPKDDDRILAPDYRRIQQISFGIEGYIIFVVAYQWTQVSVNDCWYTFTNARIFPYKRNILEYIRKDRKGRPSKRQTRQYWMFCRLLMQRMKRMTSKED